MEDRFMNVDETSAYTRLAKQTLYDYAHKRKIPYLKAGKRLLFSASELEKWLHYGGNRKASERVIKERSNYRQSSATRGFNAPCKPCDPPKPWRA